jgi:acyl carrier protein
MRRYIGKRKDKHKRCNIMEEKLLDIFRKIFTDENPENITIDSEFREFEQYSSLTQMELIETIMNEMKVQLKLRPFIKAETIGDVLEIILDQS